MHLISNIARSMPSLAASVFATTLLITPLAQADDLTSDVKAIKAESAPKVLRCVLNGNPRTLAIELSGEVAVGYDTWHGGIFIIWKPSKPDQPFKLDGAVYTGAHGPQPTSNGTTISENKSPKGGQRYHSSDSASKLHYLGHKVGENGLVTLSFAFRNTAGKQIALIEDSALAGKNHTLHRQLKVTGLAEGQQVKVDFPTGLSWTAVTENSVTITKDGTSTFKTKLP